MDWPDAGAPMVLVCSACGERLELDIDLDFGLDSGVTPAIPSAPVEPVAPPPAAPPAVPAAPAAAAPVAPATPVAPVAPAAPPAPAAAAPAAATPAAATPVKAPVKAPKAVRSAEPMKLPAITDAGPAVRTARPAVRVIQESTSRRPVMRGDDEYDDDDDDDMPMQKPPPRKTKKKMRMGAAGAQHMQMARPSVAQERATQKANRRGKVGIIVAAVLVLILVAIAPFWMYNRKYAECGNYTIAELRRADYANEDDRRAAIGLASIAHAEMAWGAETGQGSSLGRAISFIFTSREAYYAQTKAAVDAHVAKMKGPPPADAKALSGVWVRLYYPGEPYRVAWTAGLHTDGSMATVTSFTDSPQIIEGPSGTWSYADATLKFTLEGQVKSKEVLQYSGDFMVLREGFNSLSIWARAE
jgi:hypothetical protein